MSEERINKYKAQVHKKSANYKNIYFMKRSANVMSNPGSWIFNKTIGGKLYKKVNFKTDKEAAIALDKALMLDGKKPINIFIKK